MSNIQTYIEYFSPPESYKRYPIDHCDPLRVTIVPPKDAIYFKFIEVDEHKGKKRLKKSDLYLFISNFDEDEWNDALGTQSAYKQIGEVRKQDGVLYAILTLIK